MKVTSLLDLKDDIEVGAPNTPSRWREFMVVHAGGPPGRRSTMGIDVYPYAGGDIPTGYVYPPKWSWGLWLLPFFHAETELEGPFLDPADLWQFDHQDETAYLRVHSAWSPADENFGHLNTLVVGDFFVSRCSGLTYVVPSEYVNVCRKLS